MNLLQWSRILMLAIDNDEPQTECKILKCKRKEFRTYVCTTYIAHTHLGNPCNSQTNIVYANTIKQEPAVIHAINMHTSKRDTFTISSWSLLSFWNCLDEWKWCEAVERWARAQEKATTATKSDWSDEFSTIIRLILLEMNRKGQSNIHFNQSKAGISRIFHESAYMTHVNSVGSSS